MGDAYLLPSIAAVVLGGNVDSWRARQLSRDGRRGDSDYASCNRSFRSMQMPEFGRQIVYGVVIIGMMLLYGRERLAR